MKSAYFAAIVVGAAAAGVCVVSGLSEVQSAAAPPVITLDAAAPMLPFEGRPAATIAMPPSPPRETRPVHGPMIS
jgi:hypothetical protein